MALDVSPFVRAVAHLDAALHSAAMARSIDVPRLIGRGAAKERLQDLLVDALDSARAANAELRGRAGFDDVRRGMSSLADAAADAARSVRAGNVAVLRTEGALVDAIDGARQARARITQFIDIERDPAITARTLEADVRAILAKPDVDITTEDIRRLALLEEVAGTKAIGMPTPRRHSLATLADSNYEGTDYDVVEELHNLRRWLQRIDIDRGPPLTAPRLEGEVRAILAKADTDITPEDVQRLALLQEVAPARGIGMPGPVGTSLVQLAEWNMGGATPGVADELRNLRWWLQRVDIERDPAITAQTLEAELRSILAKRNSDVRPTDLRRFALLSEVARGRGWLGMPEQRLLAKAADWNEGGRDPSVALELRSLRRWFERLDIERNPAITARKLQSEMRAILAKPDRRITAADVRRLAVLKDVTGEKALGMPGHHGILSLAGLADRNHGRTREVATELVHLRVWRDAADIDADPAATAAALRKEAARIALLPEARFTREHLRRLYVLSEVSSAKSPGIPAPRDYGYDSLATWDLGRAFAHLQPLHDWAVASSPAGAARVAARLRAGEDVSTGVLTALAGRESELLQRGVQPHSILDMALRRLRDRTGAANQVPEHLLLQKLLTGVELDAAFTGLRDETLELIQRNLDRMQGRRHDGMLRYPDTAEVGRVAENVELLARMLSERRGAATGSPLAAATVDRSAATLRW